MSVDSPAEQSLYDWDSTEDFAQFYADCRKMSIPGVQFVAELPAAYARANECQRCDDATQSKAKPRFVIEHECLELRVRAECCPDHAAELVREIGGRSAGTRIDDRQDGDTWQGTLAATSDGAAEEGKA